MSIEIFLKKKQNPAQCKNTADLLGWFWPCIGASKRLYRQYRLANIIAGITRLCAVVFCSLYRWPAWQENP